MVAGCSRGPAPDRRTSACAVLELHPVRSCKTVIGDPPAAPVGAVVRRIHRSCETEREPSASRRPVAVFPLHVREHIGGASESRFAPLVASPATGAPQRSWLQRAAPGRSRLSMPKSRVGDLRDLHWRASRATIRFVWVPPVPSSVSRVPASEPTISRGARAAPGFVARRPVVDLDDPLAPRQRQCGM